MAIFVSYNRVNFSLKWPIWLLNVFVNNAVRYNRVSVYIIFFSSTFGIKQCVYVSAIWNMYQVNFMYLSNYVTHREGGGWSLHILFKTIFKDFCSKNFYFRASLGLEKCLESHVLFEWPQTSYTTRFLSISNGFPVQQIWIVRHIQCAKKMFPNKIRWRHQWSFFGISWFFATSKNFYQSNLKGHV